MGSGASKKICIPEMQRLSYDMTPLKELKVPIIWLIGGPGTGRDTQSAILEDFYGFDVIKIGGLLRQHASNETDRGRVIKENIEKKVKVIPDTIIIDIIKEEMLSRAPWSCGFLLNGFPRNAKQADMFVNEIGDVDVIVYLTCKVPMMISRSQFKYENRKIQDIKDEIQHYHKTLAKGIKKYNAKIERFDSSKAAPDILFPKIQSAIDVRVYSGGNEREHPSTALSIGDIHD